MKPKHRKETHQEIIKTPNPPLIVKLPPPPPVPQRTTVPTITTTTETDPKKLFIVRDGEIKSIKKSNIVSSGIIRPIATNSNGPAADIRPIHSSFIVNNEIAGGIMTMDQYRKQMDTHRRNQIMQRAVAAAADPVTIYKVIRPTDIDLDSTVEFAQVILKNKPGRKKGVTNKKVVNESCILEPLPIVARTRSGRISRPPRHIQRFYTKGNGTAEQVGGESLFSEEDELDPPPSMRNKPRRFFERLKCDQCDKSYVNEQQLQHHITVAHVMGQSGVDLPDDSFRIDCFNFLLAKLKKIPAKLRGKIFLDEMAIFVAKVQRLMQRMIRNFEDTCMTDAFLNYSQVHQIPKALETVLNVSGQVHFNTEVIDADEKTILGEGENKVNGGDQVGGGNRMKVVDRGANLNKIEGGGDCGGGCGGESAMSGFDDSSTQPLLDEGQKDSFSDHIISLEDAIYGPVVERQTTSHGAGDVNLLSSEEEEDDDDDDLTTPKKEHPSPARRLKKLKRVMKNLNNTNSFPVPDANILSSHAMNQNVNAAAEVGTTTNRPVIDLSMELFQSPIINRSSRGGGGGSSMPNNNDLS